MATIQIDPIEVKSRGGHAVTITGLRPTDTDCLVGSIVTPGKNLSNEQWNLSGIMRGGVDACNLDMSSAALEELARLARQLGAV